MTWSKALWRRLAKIWGSASDCFSGCFSGTIADPGKSSTDTNSTTETTHQPERFTRLNSQRIPNSNNASHTPTSNGVVNHAFSENDDGDNDSLTNCDTGDTFSVLSRTHSSYSHQNERSRELSRDNASAASI